MQPNNFAAAKIEQERLDNKVREAKAVYQAVPGVGSGPMGMTPDHVKATPEYKAAKQALDRAFRNLQDYNKDFVKRFAAELKAERQARRASK